MDIDDDDEEEDEEMLELKLQAIQARLKLKKLQSARAKKSNGTDRRPRSESNPIPDISVSSRTHFRSELSRPDPPLRPQSQTEVQVPASPVRRTQITQSDGSPSRVRLGIDKGIKAKDISLKRAPIFRKPTEPQNTAQGSYLRRSRTPAFGSAPEPTTKQERPLTFSERLAAARSEESSRQERQERIKQSRSNAFELGRQEMEDLKSNAKEIPNVPTQPEQYSREEVMAASRIKRSNTMPTLRRPSQDENRSGSSFDGAPGSQADAAARNKKMAPSEVPEEDASAFEPYSAIHLSKRVIPHSILTRNLAGKKTYVIKDLLKHVKAPDFELPEVEQDIVVFGILASKSDPRSHKPANNLKAQTDQDKGKYMVLQLVDLQWELELFLFNTGFDRYWKLVPGTLIAILNPNIMPPPPGRTDTGRFSLVINSGHDTILEIGTARDLGFCKSTKKDGQYCNSWVNKKRTEFCEFHMNMGLAKHRQARQDVNAFNTGLGPKKDGDSQYKNSYRSRNLESNPNDPKKKGRGNYDRNTQSQWFINKPSAASMLDNEVLGGQVSGRVERSEALRRRLATEEKERDLMKTLGKMGSGAGKEYMQRGANDASNTGSTQTTDGKRPDADARSLGLLPGKGFEPRMHLSPTKRKRPQSALSSGSSSLTSSFDTNRAAGTSSSASHRNGASGRRTALGWGGGLQDKLSRMKGGEKLRPTAAPARPPSSRRDDGHSSSSFTTREAGEDGNSSSFGGGGGARSPARKKTRFVTEKGIREAGRESVGGELASIGEDNDKPRGRQGGGTTTTTITSSSSIRRRRGMVVLDEDDDDELEILLDE